MKTYRVGRIWRCQWDYW